MLEGSFTLNIDCNTCTPENEKEQQKAKASVISPA